MNLALFKKKIVDRTLVSDLKGSMKINFDLLEVCYHVERHIFDIWKTSLSGSIESFVVESEQVFRM